MAALPHDPDQAPRFEVCVYDDEDLILCRQFATLETAEAFADESTEEIPGRRARIEDLARTRSFEDEVRADTALAEDYPRADPDAPDA